MNSKIMFMIINNRVEYLNNEKFDHREWYNVLGLDPNNFDNIIRGYIVDNKIIFFKGLNFNYDEEVIQNALKYAKEMRTFLNNPNLEVWCGILAYGGYDNRWEPVYRIQDSEIESFVEKSKEEEIKKEVVIPKEQGPVIDFKNDVTNPKFIKVAVIYSIITLILTIILKVTLISMKIYSFSNFSDFLLTIIQIGLLIGSIVGYIQKKEYAKYMGVGAGIALCLTFHIFDIILGITFALFNIDANMYVILFLGIKNLINKIKKK